MVTLGCAGGWRVFLTWYAVVWSINKVLVEWAGAASLREGMSSGEARAGNADGLGGMGDLGTRVEDTHIYTRAFARGPTSGVCLHVNAPQWGFSGGRLAGEAREGNAGGVGVTWALGGGLRCSL